MKRALLIGINDYFSNPLSGCVNDASSLSELLEKNEDVTPNFDCQLLTGDSTNIIDQSIMDERIEALFAHEADVVLFYFSGHGGYSDVLGGYLVSQNHQNVPMNHIISRANSAAKEKRIKEIIIILDCCHSGAIGSNYLTGSNELAIHEGIAILTASRSTQYSMEIGNSGVFTSLIIDALNGGAADALGNVSISSAYGYADQALGAWDQRPLLKANLSKLTAIRKCLPKIELTDLDTLLLFSDPFDHYMLDSSFEYTCEEADSNNVRVFKSLQRCWAAGLVKPVGEEYMYWAAMNNKSCILTPLGRYYWSLKQDNKI